MRRIRRRPYRYESRRQFQPTPGPDAIDMGNIQKIYLELDCYYCLKRLPLEELQRYHAELMAKMPPEDRPGGRRG